METNLYIIFLFQFVIKIAFCNKKIKKIINIINAKPRKIFLKRYIFKIHNKYILSAST